jgi:ribosomal protein S18 acetylase RimI-like enzyme
MSLTRARRRGVGARETFPVISIDELERAAAPGWRGLEEEPLGGWLLRAAAGFTGRANSALAAGDPGLPLATAAGRVRAWYGARSLPAMIAVPYPAGAPRRSELDVLLAGLGWTPRARPATVMIAPADAVAASHPGGAPAGGGGGPADDLARVEVDDEPDAAWLGRYHYRGAQLPPVAWQVLMSAPWQAFASVRADGATIAIGRVAGAGCWAGLTAIEVDRQCRRRGLGAAVTAALAAAARSRGFDRLYLQVEDDNAAARALYVRLGFADHHGYHYRVAPASS